MKTKIFISALMACTVAMTSCSDFLTEDPKGQMVPENYFTSQNDLDGAINVLYAQVQYSINGSHSLSPNWMGDDITALTSGNKMYIENLTVTKSTITMQMQKVHGTLIMQLLKLLILSSII